MPLPTIQQALTQARLSLSGVPDSAPDLEANVLLGFVLNKPRSYLYAWPTRRLHADTLKDYTRLLDRRGKGEPLAYITGRREFWSLELAIDHATLIPRPETELLVERALDYIPENRATRIADLGTGSGAVALAIAKERPFSLITATDISSQALAIARQNIARLRVSNVSVTQGTWFEPLRANPRLDVIVTNPPYIAAGDPHLARGDLAWEPISALQSGSDGLKDIRIIAREAPRYLRLNGRLLLEHGYAQGATVRNILLAQRFSHIRTHRDLAGLERVTEGRIGAPSHAPLT